tara:strand:- start:1250 stop:1984 length:735 start_codon:yes stop_codon:yes gene_type:complete
MKLKNKHKGQRCFIVATGSSINGLDLSLLKNEITIGINLILRKKGFTPNYLCVADTTVIERHYNDIFNDKMKEGIYVINNGCNIANSHHPKRHGNCHLNPGSTCRGIELDPKFKNIFTVKHDEKSGIHENHTNYPENTKLLKTNEYYIDEDLKTITGYGGSTIDNLAIPLAAHLGFSEIYLIGADAGYDHFYDNISGRGKRDWINYKHVIPHLKKLNIKLFNSDPTNYFQELKYKKYEDICGHR